MFREVKTRYGMVRGIRSEKNCVTIFRGIPYAAPPIGENRWREPQKMLPWKGIKLCDQYASACLQLPKKQDDFFFIESCKNGVPDFSSVASEDCLYLNIWTPTEMVESREDDRRPVLIWIHGGGYTRGSSFGAMSDGEIMASRGIIVVSINYRLNIFGFFKHPELEKEQGHSGNYALLDQAAAIRWVYENIENFGGDPKNITICGQSAGSKSVECLSVMPQTKGMVSRAIMQSCSFDAVDSYDWEFDEAEAVENNSKAFCEFVGAHNIMELRAIPGKKLLYQYGKFVAQGYMDFRCICEDGYSLFKNPGRAIAAGEEHISSLIIGCTNEESKLMPYQNNITRENYCAKIAELPKVFAPMAAIKVQDDDEAVRIFNQWFAWYDNNVNYSICSHMARHGKNSYCYSFQRQIPGEDEPGVFHTADIPYAFGNLSKCWRPYTKEDYELERVMSGFWENYIKTGNPNREGLPVWEVFSDVNPRAFILDVKTEMKNILPKPFDGLYKELCKPIDRYYHSN